MTENTPIVEPRRPWKKVAFVGVIAIVSFVVLVILAFIDGITGIPLQNVAVYFGYVFLLAMILTIIFTAVASVQTYFASETHQRAKAAANQEERRFDIR